MYGIGWPRKPPGQGSDAMHDDHHHGAAAPGLAAPGRPLGVQHQHGPHRLAAGLVLPAFRTTTSRAGCRCAVPGAWSARREQPTRQLPRRSAGRTRFCP